MLFRSINRSIKIRKKRSRLITPMMWATTTLHGKEGYQPSDRVYGELSSVGWCSDLVNHRWTTPGPQKIVCIDQPLHCLGLGRCFRARTPACVGLGCSFLGLDRLNMGFILSILPLEDIYRTHKNVIPGGLANLPLLT